MINLKVRLKNKLFWLAIIPAIMLLVQLVLDMCGVQVELEQTERQIMDIVNAAFAVLSIMGIVADPTTDGLADSARAMTYTEPYKEEDGSDD